MTLILTQRVSLSAIVNTMADGEKSPYTIYTTEGKIILEGVGTLEKSRVGDSYIAYCVTSKGNSVQVSFRRTKREEQDWGSVTKA